MKPFFLQFIGALAGALIAFCFAFLDFPLSFICAGLTTYFFWGEYRMQGIPRKFRKGIKLVVKFERELQNSNGRCVKSKRVSEKVGIYIYRDARNFIQRVVCYYCEKGEVDGKDVMKFAYELRKYLNKISGGNWGIAETVDGNLVPSIF